MKDRDKGGSMWPWPTKLLGSRILELETSGYEDIEHPIVDPLWRYLQANKLVSYQKPGAVNSTIVFG